MLTRVRPLSGVCRLTACRLKAGGRPVAQPAVRARAPGRARAHAAALSAPAASAQQAVASDRLASLLLSGGKLTAVAQTYWQSVVRPGDCVVDATAGNGHDSLFLARLVGPAGLLYSFDVQEEALQATRATLDAGLEPSQRPRVLSLVYACHSTMLEHVRQRAQLVVFNLGYLPGAGRDRAIMTQAGSTVAAVRSAMAVVAPGGLVSVLAYVGHEGGLPEYEAVREVAAALAPEEWTTTEQRLLNRALSPILVLFLRRPAKHMDF